MERGPKGTQSQSNGGRCAPKIHYGQRKFIFCQLFPCNRELLQKEEKT